MGQTGADGLLAAAWTPDVGLAEDGEAISVEMVWAALDCPSIWAVGHIPENAFNVLARQRVESVAPVAVGEPAIVTAWPTGHDGRMHTTEVAIHDSGGRLLARAESLLIEVPRPE